MKFRVKHLLVQFFRMSKVWKYDFLHIFKFCHFITILTGIDKKFEPPQVVGSQTKAAANGRPIWITHKSEIGWKKGIVDVFRTVSQSP